MKQSLQRGSLNCFGKKKKTNESLIFKIQCCNWKFLSADLIYLQERPILMKKIESEGWNLYSEGLYAVCSRNILLFLLYS